MEQSTITRLVSDAEYATTLPEVKRCVENLAMAVALINRELQDAKPKANPKAGAAAALLNFQDSKKNRVRR